MLAPVVISLALAVMWCLLIERFDLGAFLAGLLVAVGVQWMFRRVKGAESLLFHRAFRPSKIFALLKLAAFFTYELLLSNIQVAIVVLSPRLRVRSALIELPIALQNDLSITALANMISLTPGTVTVDVSPDLKSLVIHCLNVNDLEAAKLNIKNRFERPLQELER
jgi:multisubunit Na+/H+ antiporter MnhE subunit